jgi:uncharacterized protein (DUF2062 family)
MTANLHSRVTPVLLPRLVAAVLLSLPLALLLERSGRTSLARLKADPTAYIKRLEEMQARLYLAQLVGTVLLLISLVLLIEGVAYLVRLVASRRGGAA